jgi:hypothetical protein
LNKITSPACICLGLETSAYLVNDIERKIEGDSVSICPGPNMAYFNKVCSLIEMVDHIYGRKNIISRTDRPNMFIKELNLYLNYFEEKIKNISNKLKAKDIKFFTNFTKNLEQGIQYYNSIIKDSKSQKLLSKAEYKFIEVKQILNNHL